MLRSGPAALVVGGLMVPPATSITVVTAVHVHVGALASRSRFPRSGQHLETCYCLIHLLEALVSKPWFPDADLRNVDSSLEM